MEKPRQTSDSDQIYGLLKQNDRRRTIPRRIADIIHVRVVELFEIISKELWLEGTGAEFC